MSHNRRPNFVPRLESLEDRTVPSSFGPKHLPEKATEVIARISEHVSEQAIKHSPVFEDVVVEETVATSKPEFTGIENARLNVSDQAVEHSAVFGDPNKEHPTEPTLPEQAAHGIETASSHHEDGQASNSPVFKDLVGAALVSLPKPSTTGIETASSHHEDGQASNSPVFGDPEKELPTEPTLPDQAAEVISKLSLPDQAGNSPVIE